MKFLFFACVVGAALSNVVGSVNLFGFNCCLPVYAQGKPMPDKPLSQPPDLKQLRGYMGRYRFLSGTELISDNGTCYNIFLLAGDDPSSILTYYRAVMTSNGWTLNTKTGVEQLEAHKPNGGLCTVSISRRHAKGGGCEIALFYQVGQ